MTVKPTDDAPENVFAGLPVESVWTYTEKLGTEEFIEDQNELPWDDPGWRRYIADTNRTFLTTLFSIDANRAYLVKTTNAATMLTVGRPALRPLRWAPDAFSLRGFPVDPHDGPPVENFFGESSAHQGQPVYELEATGLWETMDPTEELEPGVAYWVYTSGASDFQGPWSVDVLDGDGLDFDSVLTEGTLVFRNNTVGDLAVDITDLFGPSPLSQEILDPSAVPVWSDLPTSLLKSLPGESTTELTLSIRRQDMAGENYGTVLAIKDSDGICFLVPVSASKVLPPGGGGGSGGGGGDSPQNHVGLWVGTATLNAVSEPHSSMLVTNTLTNGLLQVTRVASPTNTTSTITDDGSGSTFPIRLIIHVDTNGVACLLKEVIQMWQDGGFLTTLVEDPDNPVPPGEDPDLNQLISLQTNDPDNPGRFILLTDDTRIQDFKEVAFRQGSPVARRISTVDFDFPETHCTFAGSFAIGNAIQLSLQLEPRFRTNPFHHRRHPDHDERDEDGQVLLQPGKESFAITRDLSLTFAAAAPDDPDANTYGYDTLRGTYRESISGLHQSTLHVSGEFLLRRVAVTGELNPPAPVTP